MGEREGPIGRHMLETRKKTDRTWKGRARESTKDNSKMQRQGTTKGRKRPLSVETIDDTS